VFCVETVEVFQSTIHYHFQCQCDSESEIGAMYLKAMRWKGRSAPGLDDMETRAEDSGASQRGRVETSEEK
jgi:hypothetical protein